MLTSEWGGDDVMISGLGTHDGLSGVEDDGTGQHGMSFIASSE